jgi:hypothetical protein
MSRALIAVGVSKAGGMTPLPGAAQDAKAMHEWASVSQGYEHCELLTDDRANPVTLADVHAAVQRALQFGDLEHLIIYFSGHGYSPAPQTEYLLLTNWNVNGNEAINLSLTVHYALSHAPLHISIIVDACRTTWSTGAPPGGGVIFNRPTTDGAAGKVDEFYATRFGFPSQEADQPNGPESFGIFSKQLLEALNGDAEEAIIARNGRRVVTSLSLERFLEETVPEASGRLGKVQYPDLTPKWREPADIYAQVAGGMEAIVPHGGDFPSPTGRPPRPTPPPPSLRTLEARAARDESISTQAASIKAVEGRGSFETANGVSLVGARIKAVFPELNEADVFLENSMWHARLPEDAVGTRLIQIADGQWADHWLVVAAFPRRVATVIVGEQGFSSLNYRTARRYLPPSGLDDRIIQMEAALAEATAALLHGVLPSTERMQTIVGTLRVDKSANPALAIIAAHICQRMGDWDTIRDLQHCEIGGGSYMPYDLVLLAPRSADPHRVVVGDFPLMSRGWALLPPDETPTELSELGRYITPSLWTMVNPEGGEHMRAYLKKRR